MPSRALRSWQTRGRKVLDEVEAAHALVGGARRACAFARQQITQAYVVLLASQFQRFCRELHSDAAQALVHHAPFASLSPLLVAALLSGRRLDRGNASSANIGGDFARLAIDIWASASACDPRTAGRREKLESLNGWRNAIAHQDFTSAHLRGRDTVRIAEVRTWRRACDCLTVDFDHVLRLHLQGIRGTFPW